MLYKLTHTWTPHKHTTEYLTPQYYNQILKKYSHDNIEDLEILQDFLTDHPHAKSILELGCGSGRATKVITQNINYKSLILTDISKRMLNYVSTNVIQPNKTTNIPKVIYEQTDLLKYLDKTKQKFDTLISLWGIGHSINPWYIKHSSNFDDPLAQPNTKQAFDLIESILIKFFTINFTANGTVFMIQTDYTSEEQLLRRKAIELASPQISKILYEDIHSPSVRIVNSVFKKLVENGIFDRSKTRIIHYLGDEIEYNSIDEALEVFMNFHLEGEFNDGKNFDKVYEFFKGEFERIVREKGRLAIGIGFWVYEGEKS